MEKEKNQVFSRRNFLRTSALASGGIVIGINYLNATISKSILPNDISELDFKDFNAYIKIAENGKVTIYSPNPEIGQGVKTAMPMIVAEELDIPWKDVIVEQAALNTNKYKRQVAGGSQSIRQTWDILRKSGATAKQMLVEAAANRWGVEAYTCSASDGVITNAKGETLGYGEVAVDASRLEVPTNAILKNPTDFKLIGKNVVNVDIDKIITGKPLYGMDYKTEGMKYVSVLRPKAFGHQLKSFDDSEAKKVSGVTQVLKFGDKIAVLANSTFSAMKGKNALKAEWEKGSTLEDTDYHDEKLNEILDGNDFEVRREDGDVEKAFAEADQVIERTYESPFLPHNCMEPMNFYANVTADRVHLVGPIQTPESTAKQVAELIKRDVSAIDLEMTRMGGGFGRRLYGDFVREAAEISSLAKQPIKLVYSREDDMNAGTYRPSIKYRIKASVKDGKVTGYHLKEAAINSNMYDLIPHFFPAGAISNLKIETGKYDSNITTGAWRAPYTNFLAFAEQSFFDEVAEMLKMDTVKLRMDLLDNVDEGADEKIEYSAKRMKETIKLVVEKGNWGKPDADTYQGFSAYYSHNSHVAEVVNIQMENGLPVVKNITVAVDCGIVVNPTGALNQVVGGAIDGIGHAMYGAFPFKDGQPLAHNFDSYRLIRMKETPQVDVHFVQNNLSPTGLGEPGLPPAGGALANAIYVATGERMYKQPFLEQMNKMTVDEPKESKT